MAYVWSFPPPKAHVSCKQWSVLNTFRSWLDHESSLIHQCIHPCGHTIDPSLLLCLCLLSSHHLNSTFPPHPFTVIHCHNIDPKLWNYFNIGWNYCHAEPKPRAFNLCCWEFSLNSEKIWLKYHRDYVFMCTLFWRIFMPITLFNQLQGQSILNIL